MPTILKLLGWRLHFYANEGNEPVHVHCQKGDCDCKYWLYEEEYDISAQYEYNLSPRDRREIRKIIFDHFELILDEWQAWQERIDAK